MLDRIHIHNMISTMDVESQSGSTTPSAGECDGAPLIVGAQIDTDHTQVLRVHSVGSGKTMTVLPRLAAMRANIANKEVDSDGA